MSADRARLIYKMFHGIRVDGGEMFYSQILNLAILHKEGDSVRAAEKAKGETFCCNSIQEGFSSGEIYLKNQKEAREAAMKAQRQAKKKGKSASTSTAIPSSGPPPSTPRPERTDPSGYVSPRQSPRSAGKFQIIHLGTIAAPGQPIDADKAKLALDTVSAAIQQLATAMQTLTSVVGQIASMLGEKKRQTIRSRMTGELDYGGENFYESVQVLERHPKLKGGDCRCKDQMDVQIHTQVQQRMEQSLQQRSVRTDEQVNMKIAT
ncbi:hypothetical protein F2Q70_00042931 [Brassica cretica]|uniref:Uncharacterized protein n=1 Tax=Brassica cretica TaxID=69181 RepID=A0A8S9KJN0_BRACR|nr:hypothetical protein F2Q70_00042931 [Brassica cretica]